MGKPGVDWPVLQQVVAWKFKKVSGCIEFSSCKGPCIGADNDKEIWKAVRIEVEHLIHVTPKIGGDYLSRAFLPSRHMIRNPSSKPHMQH
jgi:hypothetical protein